MRRAASLQLLSSIKLLRSLSSSSISSSIYTFGDSSNGALGLSSSSLLDAYEPTKIPSLPSSISSIAAGHYHSLAVTSEGEVSFGWGHALALTKDGKLFGWGYCKDGRLGQMGQALCTQSEEFPDPTGPLENPTSMLEIVEKLVARKIEEEGNMPIVWEPQIVEELSGLKVSDIACGLDHSLILPCE